MVTSTRDAKPRTASHGWNNSIERKSPSAGAKSKLMKTKQQSESPSDAASCSASSDDWKSIIADLQNELMSVMVERNQYRTALQDISAQCIMQRGSGGGSREIKTLKHASQIACSALHPIKKQCANCRWSMPLEGRYDQLRCTNDNSPEAWGDVEATGCCDSFLPNAKGQPPAGDNTPTTLPNE